MIMHADSEDEEAAAACTVADGGVWHGTLAAQVSSASLVKAAMRLGTLQRELRNFDVCVPEVIAFRVDGKLFSVQREALLKDPQSVIFLMVSQHFCGNDVGQRSSDVIEIPCRDATLFGMLLNLLRGYRNPVPVAYREACFAEARFYGLLHSWETRYPVPSTGPFRPLLCGDRLFSDVTCAAASPFYKSGVHCITFGVVRCETAALGVVADDACLGWMESIGRCEGLALYWNDGRVAHNFGVFVTEKTGCIFSANATIMVELDCEENIVKWTLSGEQNVAVLRLPPKMSFAFAAVAVKSSEVQILRGE